MVRLLSSVVVVLLAVAASGGRVRACDAHEDGNADTLTAPAHVGESEKPAESRESGECNHAAHSDATEATETTTTTQTPIVLGHADLNTPSGPFSYSMGAPFYSLEQFPRFKLLQDHWQEIRDEANAIKPVLEMRRMQYEWGEGAASFAERLIAAENKGWVVSWDGGGRWLNYALAYFGNIVPGVTEAWAPKTTALLRQIPGIRVGGFSRLLPDAYIAPHTDTTGLIYRSMAFHLCLSGTANLRLGNDWVQQSPGKVLIFDTTLNHEVLNDKEDRIVLYLDFDIDIFLRETEGRDLSGEVVYE